MLEISDEVPVCVVLDNGSHTIKTGFAGDDGPVRIFRTVKGTPLLEDHMIKDSSKKKCYVGDEVIANMDVLDIRRPIERGIVTDWDAMETVWHHVFDDICVKPSNVNVLVTEPQMNPKSNREKLAQIMFEKIQPQGMYIFSSNVLSHYACGRVSGLVVDSGYEMTSVVCVYEGYKVSQCIFRSDIGGNDVTNYLIELLGKRGYSFTTAKEIEEANTMKDRLAFVAENPEAVDVDSITKDYTLSNGNTIHLGYERFQCVEAMFKPKLIGSNDYGIHELVLKSIKSCPFDTRLDICANVIITGGNTMIDGLSSRLDKEIRAVLPTNIRIKVIAPPERRYSSWIGGSIVGSLYTARQMCMRPAEYDEFGPNIVYRPQFFNYW
ncbi:actin, clone 302-like [Ylistrum balloti]|uniref:actin, clone 302-like n=1 Tax=Ylistrum balloti TaxID=509963 RepID=UPI0029059F74|nr:actin, clone 302-like [Ylistrum balloti]